jgi:hypothetical protein
MRADQPSTSNVPERKYRCGVTGTGAAHPTKRYGDGIAVTRTAVGVLRFTFASHPGYFRGWEWGLGDSTPADVKGHTVTRGAFVPATSSASAYIELSLWDSAFAADDLNATEELDVVFVFSEISTS